MTPPSAQTEYGAVNNPSYDKSLSPEQRLRDFMGAYHIVLHGVNAHEPFYLKYEGKPNERCDDEDKNSFVRFLNILVEDIKASERTRLLSVESMKMEEIICGEDMMDSVYHRLKGRNELRQSILSEMEKGK